MIGQVLQDKVCLISQGSTPKVLNQDPYIYVMDRNIIIDQIFSSMQKQKLAEMVLLRMKEKREEEERNRPHHQVLRLEVVFLRERGIELRGQIGQVEEYLHGQRRMLQELQLNAQQLDNTGKRVFPRIIVRPQFIASQKVDGKFKQFLRKSSNSFLRYDILRKKEYERGLQYEHIFMEKAAVVAELAAKAASNQDDHRRNINKRRINILKQQLRLRGLKQQQQAFRREIRQQQQDNADLIREYNVKKDMVESSCSRMDHIQSQIKRYKAMIEARFNPEAYREHLRISFASKIKNEVLRNNLTLVKKEIERIKMEIEAIQNDGDNQKTNKRQVSSSKSMKHMKQSVRRLKTQQKSNKKNTLIYTQKTQKSQHSRMSTII